MIEVPCQDTLDNHMRGKDHINRQMQLQEQRRERGEGEENKVGGYKTGPREMAKLSNSEREELIQLRKQNKILQEGEGLPDREGQGEEGVWMQPSSAVETRMTSMSNSYLTSIPPSDSW